MKKSPPYLFAPYATLAAWMLALLVLYYIFKFDSRIIIPLRMGNITPLALFVALIIIISVLVILVIWNNIQADYDAEAMRLTKQFSNKEKGMRDRIAHLENQYSKKVNDILLQFADKEKELDEKRGVLDTEHKAKLLSLEKQFADKEKELDKKRSELDRYVSKANIGLDAKEKRIIELISSTSPFSDAASMAADVEMAVFKDSERYLRNKRIPAPVAAVEVRSMRLRLNDILSKSNEIKYKYEFILQSFPEIQHYVDDDQDLMAAASNSYKDLEENRDRRQDYLSKEEYARLSESERSQLALDRYLNGKKTAWQIGRDYEMSCAFQLKRQGYHVEMHGIKYGVEDLGRDLIAHMGYGGLFGKEILVIQCKNWNKDRPIRENVIMQLYGSATAYAIEYKRELNIDIRPVLMIPAYTQLSETAEAFAKKLKIDIMRYDNVDYPRIKCNVNHSEKIYHLPFDQLYDRTEIKNPGERYAYTVKEAESHGFRRAQRHNFKQSFTSI